MKYVLDGKKMVSREEAHKYLKETFGFPEYYGENLDALHDCLTSLPEETSLTLQNWDTAAEGLGRYAQALKRVLEDSQEENPRLKIHFE